jgi:peptide/nickel transport system substrate-binding protein
MAACGKPEPTVALLPTSEMGVRTATPVPTEAATATAVPPTKVPTKTPKPPTATPVPTPTTAVPTEFKINGVTVPCKRSEAYVGTCLPYVQYDGFNPFAPGGHDWTIGYQQYSHEYLWYVNYNTGEVVPWLAESHEYSPDYKTLKIHTRKEAEWNDGVPFTAEDIAFTMNMLKNDTTLAARPIDVDFWDKIYADPNDPYTCIIEMIEPRPRQHTLFWCKVTSGQWIMPKHIWEKEDPHTFKNSPPVTTGPYMWYGGYLEQKVVLWQRNENYWGKKIGRFPAPKFLVGAASGDPEAALTIAKKHIYDTAQVGYQVWIDNQKDLPTLVYGRMVDGCVRGYIFNCASEPHMSKPEFRRALCMLMNREKWGNTMMGTPPVPVAKAHWPGYANMDQFINEEAKEKWGTYKYNPEKAMELLTGLGYKKEGRVLLDPDGKAVTLRIQTPGGPGGIEWNSAMDLITEMSKLGMDVTIKHYDMPVSNENFRAGDFDIGSRWLCETLDPVNDAMIWGCKTWLPIGELLPGPPWNRARLCNEEFDALVAKLNVIAPDAPEAHDLYMQLFDKHLELSPTTGTVETPVVSGFDEWYWQNQPQTDNMYTVPMGHWPQFMFIFFNVKPSGREETSTE